MILLYRLRARERRRIEDVQRTLRRLTVAFDQARLHVSNEREEIAHGGNLLDKGTVSKPSTRTDATDSIA